MLRVYVSSTLSDLSEHRQEAIDAIRSIRAVPVALEDFAASQQSAVNACLAAVRNSDVVVVIVAHKYGVIPAGSSTGFVELEFNEAIESRIPILAFKVDDEYSWPRTQSDSGELANRLEKFKERLKHEVTVEHFTTPSDLGVRLLRALRRFQKQSPDTTAVDVSAKAPIDMLIKIEKHLQTLHISLSDVQTRIESSINKQSTFSEDTQKISPPAFLGPAADLVEKDLCFVAMPYSKSWSEALQTTLVEICENEGFRILVAKDMSGRSVHHDIWDGITRAGTIIADITDGNPNVAYEIGLADVIGKNVVLLCQGTKVPFDFLGQRLIVYEDTMKGAIRLREELATRLRELQAR